MFSRVTDDELTIADSEVLWFMIIDKKVLFVLLPGSKAGGVLCNVLAGCRHRRTFLPVPMRLLKWGSPSILRNIGTLVLFFGPVVCYQFHMFLHPWSILVVVWGSWLRKPRFLCIASVGWRGTHCVFSNSWEDQVDKYWSNDLEDFEWAFPSWSDFLVVVRFQVPRV